MPRNRGLAHVAGKVENCNFHERPFKLSFGKHRFGFEKFVKIYPPHVRSRFAARRWTRSFCNDIRLRHWRGHLGLIQRSGCRLLPQGKVERLVFALRLALSQLIQELPAPPDPGTGQAFSERADGRHQPLLFHAQNNDFVPLARLNSSLNLKQALTHSTRKALSQKASDEIVTRINKPTHGAALACS
jgi:hypothetical protein